MEGEDIKSSFSLFITFPNVRVTKSNVEEILQGTVVDIVLYEYHFTIVPVCSDNGNANNIKKFCCPQMVTTSDDDEGSILQVEMWEGFVLGFEVEQRCQAWLCQEFKQLQM